MTSFIEKSRFHWGINIDNMWVYAGVPAPKSIVVPYLLSVRLPRGPARLEVRPEEWSVINSLSAKGSEPEEVRKDCAILARFLKDSGIEFVRGWFQWNFFEPRIQIGSSVEAEYKYPLDDFVNYLTTEGIEIIAVVGNGYTRFLPERINLDNVEDYVNRLKESTRAIVTHYKDKIHVWQIENEPNWWLEHYSAHWRTGGIWLEPKINQIILENMHSVVRAEDPSATITINLEADHVKTNWNMFTKYCDVLGLDFYPNYSHSEPVDASILKSANEVKKESGVPVFVAETGYPSGPRIFGYSEQNQDLYTREASIESHSCDSINGIAIWRLSDSYWHSFPTQENHFGLLDRQDNPKLAWNEYINQIKQLR